MAKGWRFKSLRKMTMILLISINSKQNINFGIQKSDSNMKEAIRVKILILGESSVGKSSLLTQYVDQKFMPSHMPTIGVEYKQKVIEFKDKELLKVQIWDTAGT